MKETKLENGMTVVTSENPTSKSATLSIVVKTGSYHEKEFPKGIAHFTEHMLFKGTTMRSAKEMNQLIDGIGGMWNAYTSNEETKYYCTVSHDFWQMGTDLLLDLIWNHTLPEEEFEKERNVILEEINMYNDEPQSLVFEELNRHLHKMQPERHSVIGTKASVRSITRDDMVKFIQQFYQPDNLVFVATGNLSHEKLVEYIQEFGYTRSGKTEIGMTPYKQPIYPMKNLTLLKDIQQTHLAWAVPTTHIKSADIPALNVIDNLLGGSSSSRLNEIIREDKGLCYSIFTSNDHGSDMGYMIGYVGTEKKYIESIKEIIFEQYERLKTEEMTEEELTRYINYTKGTFVLQIEQNGALNHVLAQSYLHGLSLDIDEMIREIEEVTVEDIKRVANTYFHRDKFVFCEVSPLAQ